MKRSVSSPGSLLLAAALFGSLVVGFPARGLQGTAIRDRFDINELTERVRSSSAIGIFTKLSLRNQVEDLLEDFRRFHEGKEAPLP